MSQDQPTNEEWAARNIDWADQRNGGRAYLEGLRSASGKERRKALDAELKRRGRQ